MSDDWEALRNFGLGYLAIIAGVCVLLLLIMLPLWVVAGIRNALGPKARKRNPIQWDARQEEGDAA